MLSISRNDVRVPMDVPADVRETYISNYLAATRSTGRLMLFACDQKVEHLNADFYGEGIVYCLRKPDAFQQTYVLHERSWF